jgi:hypothetical protein
MKKIIIILIVILFISISYKSNAQKKDTIKGTPMLAITPNGDTIQVLLEDVVKAKKEKKQKRTIVVNNYTYYNYDNWRFLYNDYWHWSHFWYDRYYHIYYPIVYYYPPAKIKKYYHRHNITIVHHHHKPHKHVYTRPAHKNPYKSNFNDRTKYERNKTYTRRSTDTTIKRDTYTPKRNNKIGNKHTTQPRSTYINTPTRTHPTYKQNNRSNSTIKREMNSRSTQSHSQRRR